MPSSMSMTLTGAARTMPVHDRRVSTQHPELFRQPVGPPIGSPGSKKHLFRCLDVPQLCVIPTPTPTQ